MRTTKCRSGGCAWISTGRNRAVAAAIAEVVTADERERAARFRFEADRQRFLHGRLLLRTFLGHQVGVPPRDVAFINSAFGKPEVPPGILRFNLAHSGEWILFALARHREVGVDVEHHRAMSDAMELARRFFAPPEVAAMEALDPAMRDDAFFRIWTRKEAIVKAHGQGLSAGLDRFAVSPDRVGGEQGDATGQVAFRGLDGDPVWARWTIHALDMPTGVHRGCRLRSSRVAGGSRRGSRRGRGSGWRDSYRDTLRVASDVTA